MTRKRKRPTPNARPKPRHRAAETVGEGVASSPILAAGRDPAIDARRNPAIDALRGLAIALMLIDHAAALWVEMPIEITNVRFLTRLAMPLFAVLMGYHLPMDGVFRWRRWGEILFASILVNVLYWHDNRELEVLASLLIAAILGTILGRFAPLLFLTFAFYAIDPIAAWFDYQLSLVLPMVAIGVTVRRVGPVAGLVLSGVMLAMTVSGRWITPTDTHRFAVWMSPVATGGLVLASRLTNGPVERRDTDTDTQAIMASPANLRERVLAALRWLGTHPLAIYVAHFYLFTMIASVF